MRLGRELVRPRREASTLTGRDTRRGHGGSLSRRRSAINTRIYVVNYRATKEDIVMDTNSRCESTSKNTKACLKSQQLEDKLEASKIEEIFLKFNKDICSCIGSRNYQHLEQLLLLYMQNISSITGSDIEFSDEINLKIKKNINKMLIFFHLYWLDIKQDIADHSQYLNKISALLNVYIDMELKTSKKLLEETTSSHDRDSSVIAAKILAALYIYLNNSEEHIFRVLLRIKYTTKKYTKVCNHIFTKSFTNLKTKTSITDVTYIRYLLAFKMWRKMKDTSKKNLKENKKKLILSDKKKERKKINKLTLIRQLLGSQMPKMQDELLKFVPLPPMGQENATLWLIQSNLFDREVHEKFLLFEDKMDNSISLECNKTIHADQNCLKSQKLQNSLFRSNFNGDISEQKIKQCLGKLPNNGNKSLDQTYLQKKGSTKWDKQSFKSLKKIKKKLVKPGIIELIDLTQEDEVSKVKRKQRKRTKRNSRYLKVMKDMTQSKKHINSSKYSGKLVNTDVKEYSNENNKSLEKIHLECKPVYDIKINDNIENCTSLNSRSSLNDDCYINLQKNEHLNMTKKQISNNYLEFAKEDEKQHDYNLHCLKSSMFVDQNIKVTANMLSENELENCVSSYVTIGNATSSYNLITQNKKTLTSQKESTMETIPLFKTCQNNIADQHSFKQEPINTNCSAMQSHKYCNTMPVDVHDLIIKKLKSINDHSSQITEIINQKVYHQINECPNCTKIDCKPFIFNNDITAVKAQEILYNTFNDKLVCDTNIIPTLSDCDKHIHVTSHTTEHMTTSAEKRMQCLNNSNGICTVSTTFTEDQIVEPPLYNQHVNFDNVKMNDYANETTIKDEQKRTDYDLEDINFLNVQSEILEDFFRQSDHPQINYENLTGVPTEKSFIYTNNDITTVKIHTLRNIFNADENDIKTPYDTNIISMLNDCDKCIHVTNHTGEHMTTNVEKKMQCLNNANDMCTVSSAFTRDQIVESSLDSQYVNSDNKKKYDYEDVSTYSKDTMKEQGRNNCDTSMSNEQLHSYELCTFDTDSFEIDSKEANEIMKTDCINDFENISFLHNIQTETLEDIYITLSNTTNFFLPLK